MEKKDLQQLASLNIDLDIGDEDEVIPLHEIKDKELSKPFASGFNGLDDYFKGGFRTGELIIISGIAKMGKTTFSLQITKNYSDNGIPVLWFSYEMPVSDIKEKFEPLGGTDNLLCFVPKKNSSDSVDWLEKKILQSYKKWLTRVIFIDNLDFLTIERLEGDDKLTVQKRIVGMLKRIAIENELIIFLNAHVHKLEEGKEPRMQNIYGASEVYKLSDAVIFVHRLRKKAETRGEQELEFTNTSKIIVDANRRYGLNGSFTVEFKEGKFVEGGGGWKENV